MHLEAVDSKFGPILGSEYWHIGRQTTEMFRIFRGHIQVAFFQSFVLLFGVVIEISNSLNASRIIIFKYLV